MLYKLVKSPI